MKMWNRCASHLSHTNAQLFAIWAYATGSIPRWTTLPRRIVALDHGFAIAKASNREVPNWLAREASRVREEASNCGLEFAVGMSPPGFPISVMPA
jgi:hypothetical protein